MPVSNPKVDLKSKSISEEQKEKLRQLFPEVFTEGKIDWERLQLTLGADVETGKERFGLTWRGKAECFRIIQEPSIGTLKPVKGESVDWDTTENLFIEGDNLETLKLLQKSYYGKVKMIYIDPPYNTGNEFIYPDKFSESLDTYLAYTGQVNAEGKKFSTNTETTGRYHSNWLDMMYPRLFLARNLLRDDGAIFVSIDDHEVHNLREMMNEIFGEENFIASIIWQKVYSPKNTAKYFSEDHDYIIIYSKNAEIWRPESLPRSDEANSRYINPDNDPRGPWKPSDLTARNYYSKGQYEVTSPSGKKFKSGVGRYWRSSYERFLELDKDNRIWWGQTGSNMPAGKRFLSEVKQGFVPQTLWKYEDVGHTQEAKKELLEFVTFEQNENVLNTVKPTRLLQRILQIATDGTENEIILDFFAGSATTAHAVLSQNQLDGGNRSFIMVQLPELLPIPESKLKSIVDIGRERVRHVIKKIGDTRKDAAEQKNLSNEPETVADLGFRAFRLDTSNFTVWDGRVPANGKVEKQIELFIDHIDPHSTDEEILYELLLKSGFALTTPVAEKKIAGKKVFSIDDNALLICLEHDLTKDLIVKMAEIKPARAICLDAGFKGNDQLRTNAMEIMKSHGVTDFRTV
ncbi:site-specific DNA-methyltransferase [Methanoregula sp.]|jgi:adenine-specific DNA-methyltransferase|uniref:site-specific DNA-methyltransferase n=1 Tax=Methanoregula sp. TaxID=2052170 RepID=UPI0025E88976|nr:site-specific DNA-methyltransferase [Methanoregula sp.]